MAANQHPATGARPDVILECLDTDVDSGEQFVVLSFPTPDGRGQCRVPRQLLIDARALRSEIVKFGGIPPDLNTRCAELLAETPRQRRRTTRVTGWHGKVLVTRHGAFGQQDPDDSIRFDPEEIAARHGRTRKILPQYRARLREPLESSTFLTFFICAALAPALADYIGGRTGGTAFCLSGDSTTGKSLTGRVVLSTSTEASEQALETLNRTTGKAIQSLGSFGGSCIPFADLKSSPLKGRDLATFIQTLIFGGHEGSQRQTLFSQASAPPRFSILLLTAEQPLRALFEAAKVAYEDGDAVRFIDIPVPPRSEGGVFDLSPPQYSIRLAGLTEAAIADCYGTLLPRWARRLCLSNPDAMKRRVEALEEKFIASLGPLNPLEARLARPFALVAAAGFLAATRHLIPVSIPIVKRAARSMFERARSQLPSQVTKPGFDAKAHVRQLLSTVPRAVKGEKPGDPKKYSRGFVRDEDGADIFYLTSSALAAGTPQPSYVHSVLLSQLKTAGAYAGPGGTAPIKQKGLPRIRYYRFDVDRLRSWLAAS